jgi:hypothetical protein
MPLLWTLLEFSSIHWDHELYCFDTIKKAKKDWSNGYFMEVFSIAVGKFGSDEMTKSLGATLLPLRENFSATVKQQLFRLS